MSSDCYSPLIFFWSPLSMLLEVSFLPDVDRAAVTLLVTLLTNGLLKKKPQNKTKTTNILQRKMIQY